MMTSIFLLLQIIATNYKENLVKVHYIGYSSRFDEWRNCANEEERISKIRKRPEPSSDTIMERISGLEDQLFRNVKYALFSTKREAPDPSIEIEIEQDEFAYLTQNYGEAFQDRNRTKYQIKKNKHLDELLGKDWDIRILIDT